MGAKRFDNFDYNYILVTESTYYILGTVVGTVATTVNKTCIVSVSSEDLEF